jgi:lysine 6-dehydrogenase
MMGRAVALDLCRSEGVDQVTVADTVQATIEGVRDFVQSSKMAITQLDVTDHKKVVEAMRGHDVAVSCVPYAFNVGLARAAIEAGCSFIDLGGNNEVVSKELSLDREAKEAGITIIPDCGLAPGLAIVLVADAVGRMDTVMEVHIRVGGLPVDPKPPLDYMLLFSPGGLVNEYKEMAVVIRDGRVQEVEALEDLEELVFPAPFGVLEAFNTSGGTSTLPRTLLGKVDALDYKTIRYKGHCERMRLLRDMGLFDETPIDMDGLEVVPRDLLEALLLKTLPQSGDDVVLVRVSATGTLEGRQRTIEYTIIDHCDKATGLTAMQRTTALPASIVAQMIATGEIGSKGATPGEMVIPTGRFLEELDTRGIEVIIDWIR